VPIAVIVTVAPGSTVAIIVMPPFPRLMAFPSLMLGPRLLPRIRLSRLERLLPPHLIVLLPSIEIVVAVVVAVIDRRTKLHTNRKLLSVRLRWSRQHK